MNKSKDQRIIEYFENKHRHRLMASSSVVPRHEYGSNFVGMDHFQSVFLEASKADYTKIVNAQKYINDYLKVVGHNTQHHSFFKMLATWSHCNAAKHSACQVAWDLLTNRYNLSSDQIYVTCFGECKDIWRSVGVSEDHISWRGRREIF
jgi:alanyl-tRNA synthetase